MIQEYLKQFGTGWQSVFTPKLEILFNKFPDISVSEVKRYFGTLRIKITALDNDTQYVVDCVTYKIERESARICENCGVKGKQKFEYLSEKKCLCWKCYALEVDAIMSDNTQTQ